MALIKPGEKAPAFTLKNQAGEDVSLEDFKGKKVLLSFHPLAFTGVCHNQMNDLETRFNEFEQKGIVPLGISIDTVPSKDVWGKQLGLQKLDMLSDFYPLGEVAKAYGNYLDDKGFSGRAAVLIDEDGQVIWSKQYDIPEQPDVDEILALV